MPPGRPGLFPGFGICRGLCLVRGFVGSAISGSEFPFPAKKPATISPTIGWGFDNLYFFCFHFVSPFLNGLAFLISALCQGADRASARFRN